MRRTSLALIAGLPARYGGRPHAAGSAIVVVLTAQDFSAMHRLQTDEVWHFYGGAPVSLLMLAPDGGVRTVTLGNDVLAGQLPQVTVPHGVWQGAVPSGTSPARYSFVGTQLSPAFDYADFEMGYRQALQLRYPAAMAAIRERTRDELSGMPPPLKAPAAIPDAHATAFATEQAPSVTMQPGVSLRELVGRVSRQANTMDVSIGPIPFRPAAAVR